jgi:hypothetical protein
MRVNRRRPLPNFEACSVALFTSLALGGSALPARAQTPSSPSVTPSTSTVAHAPRSGTTRIGPAIPASGAKTAPKG